MLHCRASAPVGRGIGVLAKVPIVGGFGAENHAQNAQERSINWMPEKIDGKSEWRLRPTPGLRLFTTLPETTIRGAYEATNSRVFRAAGQSIYEIYADGTFIRRGGVSGQYSRVYMDDNGFQLVIVNGVGGWVLNFATNEFVAITSDGFSPSPQVVVFDGIAVMFKEDSGVYFYSEPYDALTYNATAEGTAESNPDNIQAIVWDGGGPVVLGTRSLEFYYDSGDPNLVFQRRQTAQLRYGCVATDTALNIDDGVMWLGRDSNSQGTVYRVSGAQPRKLSSIFIDEAVEKISDLSASTAMAYEQSGHGFYCLNIPGTDTTYVCDLTTTYWHERRSFDVNGNWSRWRVENHSMGFGLHLGDDFESGNIYIIDPDYRKDNDQIIRRERTMSPLFDAGTYKPVSYNMFTLDIDIGNAGQDEDPQIVMYVSNDGGKSYSDGRTKSLGKIGEYRTTISWNRLGSGINRVFKIATASDTNVTIYNAFLETS